MRSFDERLRGQTGTPAVQNSFTATARALDPTAFVKMSAVLVLAMLSVLAIGIMTLHPSNASQAQDVEDFIVQGQASTKADRAATPSNGTCETQAWGQWTEECAAAISGTGKVRKVSFMTVNSSTASANETILARYAVN